MWVIGELLAAGLRPGLTGRGLPGRRNNLGERPVVQTRVVMPENCYSGTSVRQAGMLVVLAFLQVALERAFRMSG